MIETKSVIAITLARGGSKGIPNKNLAIINNKSLLQRAIECGRSKYIDSHYVSSDSEKILSEAKNFGAKTIIRPPEFAYDTSSSFSAIEHALNLIEKPDYVIEIMCTSPFKTQIDVDSIIEKLHSTQADAVVGVTRIYDHHPARLKYIENDVLVNFFPEKKESRRQDLEPHAYVRNGSLYAFTYNSFVKYQSRYGGIVRPYIMDDITSINIDEPNDLILAKIIGEKHGI